MKWVSIILFSFVVSLGCLRRPKTAQDAGPFAQDAGPFESPPGRSWSAMTYDERQGLAVVFGGISSSGGGGGRGALGDIWGWNGSRWTQLTKTGATAPRARESHAMAYDSDRGVTTVFSGISDFSANTDTWEWNGTAWSVKNPTTNAPERYCAGMTYNADRHVTQMFGGDSWTGNHPLDDLWEWDGTKWTEITPAGVVPAARSRHALAYDSNRHRLVMFGGCPGAFACNTDTLAETWEWDGTVWTKASPALSPPGRHDFAMAYDSERKVTTIFGGWSDVAPLSDTWEWNGDVWKDVTPATGEAPPERAGTRMAYDSARHVQVLFGGLTDKEWTPGTGSNETWEWDGILWERVAP